MNGASLKVREVASLGVCSLGVYSFGKKANKDQYQIRRLKLEIRKGTRMPYPFYAAAPLRPPREKQCVYKVPRTQKLAPNKSQITKSERGAVISDELIPQAS